MRMSCFEKCYIKFVAQVFSSMVFANLNLCIRLFGAAEAFIPTIEFIERMDNYLIVFNLKSKISA